MAQEKAKGPVVLVDAGDALLKVWPSALEAADRPNAEKRASFLLEQMARLGYSALAVGERELVFPPERLAQMSKLAKLPLLASNLADAKGKKPFPGRTLVNAGGRKVGVFAVVQGGEYENRGYKVLPMEASGQAEIDALRKEGAELIVGLLHMPYDTALWLSGTLKGLDYAIQGHDGRPVLTQPIGQAILAGGGQRGQQLGKAVFVLDGKGPFQVLEDPDKLSDELRVVDDNARELAERLKKPGEDPERLKIALSATKKRREEILAKVTAKPGDGRRTVASSSVVLDAKVPDEPATKQAQEATLQAAPERR